MSLIGARTPGIRSSRTPSCFPSWNVETVTGNDLAATFDAPVAFTVGLEEEIMLLEPRTLELSDRAPELLERLELVPTFKLSCRRRN